MDAHLKAIEGVGALTARRLAHTQAKNLGRHTDRASDLQLLGKSLGLEISAHLLEGLDVAGGKGDANAVDGGLLHIDGLGLDWDRHF